MKTVNFTCQNNQGPGDKISQSKKNRFFKRASAEKRFYLLIADLVSFTSCVVLGFLLSVLIKPYFFPDPPQMDAYEALQAYPWLFGIPGLLIILVSNKYAHYTQFKGFWDEYGEFLKISVSIACLTTAYLFFTKSTFSRFWLGATWGLVLLIVPMGRLLAKYWMMHAGRWFSPTVVIGTGRNALEAALAMESDILMGFSVVALIDINQPVAAREAGAINDVFSREERHYPILSFCEDTLKQLDDMGSPYIVLALESEDYNKHRQLLERLAGTHRNMSVIPSMRGMPLLGSEISPIFRYEVLHLRIRNNLANKGPRLIKRLFDIIVSGSLLVMLAPLFIFLIWKIRKDGGPAFFFQERIGKSGEPFVCYKFRSMCMDADKMLKQIVSTNGALRDEFERDVKLKIDPRITKAGVFLRKTSLDELPQLWNVFKGDMSLVGPRPVPAKELEKYGAQMSYYLETPPGITGLWQISGRNHLEYSTRVSLDAWYVRNWSLWYDVVILFKTINVVLGKEGAY